MINVTMFHIHLPEKRVQSAQYAACALTSHDVNFALRLCCVVPSREITKKVYTTKDIDREREEKMKQSTNA